MNKEEILKMLKQNMSNIQVKKEVDYNDICDLYTALIFIIAFGFGDDVKNE